MQRVPPTHPQDRALADFLGSVDRFDNFLGQVKSHNLGRNLRVLKLLAILARMKRAGLKLDGHVDCVAAHFQNFKSSRPNEAAHFLPGQLTIGAKPVSKLAATPAVVRALEFLFAEVEDLPAPINHADSEAESKGKTHGLCAALVAAVNVILRDPANLKAAYEEWNRKAIAAFEHGMLNKGAKEGIPVLTFDLDGNIDPEVLAQRSNPNMTQWNRTEATRVLHYYLEDQRMRGLNVGLGKIPSVTQEVDLLFR